MLFSFSCSSIKCSILLYFFPELLSWTSILLDAFHLIGSSIGESGGKTMLLNLQIQLFFFFFARISIPKCRYSSAVGMRHVFSWEILHFSGSIPTGVDERMLINEMKD